LATKYQAVRIITMLSSLLLSTSVFSELVVEDGFVRKPIPGRSMSAAFMTISNTGTEDVVLTTAAIDGAKSVEIHTHSHQDGVMRMRQLHSLEIKSGHAVSLEPGGLHLMIFGIKILPEKPNLTLCDEAKRCYQFPLPVRDLVKRSS
jgi:copper(I)-binding protein